MVPKSEVHGQRIFGLRFVDTIKNQGTPQAYSKSRLVVQGYNDDAEGLLTYAPTVQRASMRLLLALAPSVPSSWKIISRDVTQAYTQSKIPLSRNIYANPPKELCLSDEMVLKIQTPLYGLPEAGLHWFTTYLKHFREKLGMVSAKHDYCLLFTPDISNRTQCGISCLQTDDTLILANNEFIKLEEKHSTTFKTNPVEELSLEKALSFNGASITINEFGIVRLTASKHISKLRIVETEKMRKDDYISQRARGAYIASICSPETCVDFSLAAQHISPGKSEVQKLNKALKHLMDTKELGLNFVKLDMESLSFGVFIDAAFANHPDMRSQLGFVTVLMDKNFNANIVHYGSSKSKRVTRSVLSAELYAMMYGFDTSSVILHTLRSFLGKSIPLRLYTDSKCLFDSLTRLNSTTEKRLLIDLSLLREAYELREITEVLWIPGKQNPADGMTKQGPCHALLQLIKNNQIEVSPNAWIDRQQNVNFSVAPVSNNTTEVEHSASESKKG